MKDDSISPDQASDKPGDTGKVYANISSLAVGEENTAPEVGDEVELTVKGTVSSVEGDVVCVSPTEVNGEPAPSAPDSAEPEGEDMAATRDSLLKQAQEADGY